MKMVPMIGTFIFWWHCKHDGYLTYLPLSHGSVFLSLLYLSNQFLITRKILWLPTKLNSLHDSKYLLAIYFIQVEYICQRYSLNSSHPSSFSCCIHKFFLYIYVSIPALQCKAPTWHREPSSGLWDNLEGCEGGSRGWIYICAHIYTDTHTQKTYPRCCMAETNTRL